MERNSYTAPRYSENYNKLLSFVREHPEGGSELADSLREILWLLNAPGHLQFFGWMTEKLERLLGHRDSLKKAYFEKYSGRQKLDMSFLDQLTKWASWYRSHQQLICNHMGQYFELGPPEPHDTNPFSKKGMSRYGLYSALVCIQEEKEFRDIWELLALRFILTHEKCYRGWSLEGYESFGGKDECPDIKDKTYIPSKNLRLLSNKDYAAFLKTLDIEALVGSKYTSVRSGGKAKGYFHGLLGYLYRTEANIKRRKRGKGYKRTDIEGRKHGFGQGYVEVDWRRSALHGESTDVDDPWIEERSIELVEILPNIDDLTPAELAKYELFPPELEEGDQLTLVEQDCGALERNAGTAALAARARNKHLATQAQMFRWRYGTLTFEQFKWLDETLRSELPRHYSAIRNKEQRERLEIVLILLVMLWTASDLNRALELSVHFDGDESMTSQLGAYDLGVRAEKNRYEWRFESLRPKYFSNPDYDDELTRPRILSFWLPDVSGVVYHCGLYKKHVRTNTKNKLFPEKEKEFLPRLKAYLSELNKVPIGEGITLKKITDFLFHHIAGETGDVTAAAYITAKPHHLVNTSIFYTTPKLDYLRKQYTQAIEPILELCDITPPPDIAEAKDEDTSVGARLCVKLDVYRSAIQTIQEDLEVTVNYSSWEEFVDFHNLFTFYTVLMFGVASAARAIKNPLIKGSDIDANGFSTYSDKDSQTPYHSRLIWLPEQVRLQLLEYERHLEVTTDWLALKSPEKDPKNDQEIEKQAQEQTTGTDESEVVVDPKKQAKRQSPDASEESVPCYFITGRNLSKKEIVRPSKLGVLYERYLKVPANAHRRLLRTELLEQGMPVEVLDAFMGHWVLGQEPWGPYSTFSFPQYVQALQGFLVPFLDDELGFGLVKSPLVMQ